MTASVVAVLAVHPVELAATRLRAMQYAPGLAGEGIDVELWTFLRASDLAAWYGDSHRRRVAVILRALTRLPSMWPVLRRASVVIVQREVLPVGPPIVEWLVSRRRPLVWDVDDALWETFVSPTAGRVPRWLRATGDKYRRVCTWADEVWAGSGVLAEWCRQHSGSVHVVPTVVEVPEQLPLGTSERSVGWIGSHSTGAFLERVLPAVAAVTPSPPVYAVGATVEGPGALALELRTWSPEAERATLGQTRVGLYPVDPAHPLAEGKCGLKAILYMSRGIPCVVTPTTTNAAVVRDGVDGLHASTPGEWTTGIQRLLDDGDLWERCHRAGHRRALEEYSLAHWGPWVAGRLQLLGGST